MSNIEQVAQLAGVSVPTVYKVFSNKQYASPAVKEKVLEAAKKLNYVHKASMKGGNSDREKVIAILVDDLTNPFYSYMIHEMSKALSRFRHHLIVYTYQGAKADMEQGIERLLDKNIDGLIFVPELGEKQNLFERLIASKYPMLQLFRPLYDEVDTLMIDDEVGTYLATKYLLQNGHRKIMLISRTNPIMVKREKGYIRAFEEANVPVDNDYLFLMTYIEANKEILKSKIREMGPTAIIAAGERISINVYVALREMNLSIPDDISLIVYDNLPWTLANDITTVSHSYEAIGNLAAELIDGRLREGKTEDRKIPARLKLDPEILLRNSVKILL